MANEKLYKELLKIANEELRIGREDLENHNSDSEDFLEVSIWGLKAALVKAYELGKQEAKG